MNKMFVDKLGKTLEVYIDDMLVKCKVAKQHVNHISLTIKTLREYNMKLNPAKSQFRVKVGKFQGYLVMKRGIEVNPDQIGPILNIAKPQSKKDIQKLTGRLAALTRFISKASEKFQPFFETLKKSKEFEWTENRTLADIKYFLTSPRLLANPENGEKPYLYFVHSNIVVSAILVKEIGESNSQYIREQDSNISRIQVPYSGKSHSESHICRKKTYGTLLMAPDCGNNAASPKKCNPLHW